MSTMSKFGSPIHYYELKRNWNGKNIKTGVRCIWIKNINVVPPDIIKQGDRQITFKETVTMRRYTFFYIRTNFLGTKRLKMTQNLRTI